MTLSNVGPPMSPLSSDVSILATPNSPPLEDLIKEQDTDKKSPIDGLSGYKVDS